MVDSGRRQSGAFDTPSLARYPDSSPVGRSATDAGTHDVPDLYRRERCPGDGRVKESQIEGENVAARLKDEMDDAVSQHAAKLVVLDLSSCRYVSSIAFWPLLAMRRRLAEQGGRMIICGLKRSGLRRVHLDQDGFQLRDDRRTLRDGDRPNGGDCARLTGLHPLGDREFPDSGRKGSVRPEAIRCVK
jgi:hypothetical protein